MDVEAMYVHVSKAMSLVKPGTVVVFIDTMLVMVGPFGDFVKYPYSTTLHMVSEYDGVRIITNHECEFLQRVPESTEDIFKIGSVSSTAMLYDAAEAYEAKSAKADENIRAVKEKGELEVAVEKCVRFSCSVFFFLFIFVFTLS